MCITLLAPAASGDVEVVDATAQTAPLRLMAAYRGYLAANPRPPKPIPLDTSWFIENGTEQPATDAPDNDNVLRLEAGDLALTLARAVNISAEKYNRLVLRMRADAGAEVALSWTSAFEPAFFTNRPLVLPLVADNAFHTYTFFLEPLTAPRWAGPVQAIQLTPSDTPAKIEIESIAFHYEPPRGPEHFTIRGVTYEGFWAHDVPQWRITVPPAAVLDFSLGFQDRAWQMLESDGARFVIALYDRFGRRHELFERTLAPTALDRHRNWIPLQLDLAKYSGRTVRLAFEIDNKATRWGDYACWGNLMVSSKRDNPQDTPVILISIDTLRRDHLSCYGYERDTSPNLSRFAMESVVFDNAMTQDVWTPTSHMTMLTGLYPKNHGLSHTTNLAEETLTLPELLREAGYLTAGYTGHSWWLLSWRGFAQGFDVYDVPDLSFRNIMYSRDRMSEWLDKHSARNFFLFFHNYDCHSKLDREGHAIPYLPEAPEFNQFASALGTPPSFDRADPHTPRATDFLIAVNSSKYLVSQVEHDHMVASYDDAILMVDHNLGELFDELRQRNQYNDALIIVVADHGESFREHGRYLHEQAYEDSARVPLLIKFPGNRYGGRRIKDLVQLTDLFPTVADVLGLETPAIDGASLVTLLEGSAAPRGHAYTGNHTFLWQGLREGDWKLLFNGLSHRYELYDLASDPGEQRNLYAQEPETAGRMRAALDEFYVRPNYGWHLFLQGGEGTTELEFSVVTQQQFPSVQIVEGEPIEGIMDRLTTSNDHRTVTGKLFAVGRDQDEVVLETLGGENEIFLNIESETEFEILLAGERIVTNHFTDTLIATDRELPKPELSHGAGEKPVISLWYDPPPVERSAAQPLSDEAIQDLEALGYITGE